MSEVKMKTKKKKIILGVIIFFICIAITSVSYAGYLYYQAQQIVTDSHEEVGRENETSTYRSEQVDPVEDNVSVLFIGVDDSEHRDSAANSRSDALILGTFNKNNNSVKLVSIPRDSYVYIPEVGYSTKINHAHAYGGTKATIETVEAFLKVPVDYYVRLNFNAFVDIVDAIDGIHFDVPYEIVESDSGDLRDAIHLSPGYQLLDGEQALALARTRKYDSDVERGKRQQEIIKIIADKISSASSLFNLEDVLQAVGANMKSNLTMPEIRGFLSYALNSDIHIENVNFQGVGDYMDDGGWYYLVDEESRFSIQDELRNHLELEPYEETVEQKYEDGYQEVNQQEEYNELSQEEFQG
ncbi:LCP family protein [Ralstonia pickettii]|nr:LCP family protein [Ralstonia pickettii]